MNATAIVAEHLDEAVLPIAGESRLVKLVGDAVLVNGGGWWRVDDALTEVVMQ